MDIILIETNGVSFPELSGFLGCVTKARAARIAKKQGDSDKVNALLGELLVLSEITARTGLPRRKISFSFGSRGKPYLKDDKLWFSLSHTNGALCAAFSSDGEIGVDIEPKNRAVSEGLKKRVLSEKERALVVSGADFLRMWVKKEAFLKRLGIGITRDLRTVDTTLLPDTAAFEAGGYLVGASGANAESASIKRMTVDELLSRYIKRN